MGATASVADVVVTKDVAYAGEGGRRIDLYVPRADGPVPVVVWMHGSAWREESGRDGADALAAELSGRGIAVAGVSVRTSGQARFPAQVEDVRAAVAALRERAGEFGIDPGRVALAGESSGAWAALVAGLDDGPAAGGGEPVRPRAVVAWYAPSRFDLMDEADPRCGGEPAAGSGCHGAPDSPESALLGCTVARPSCRERVAAAAPGGYAKDSSPPVLLLHGGRDETVPPAQSAGLFAELRRRCADVTLVTLPEAGHGSWATALTDPALRRGGSAEESSGCGDPAPAAGPAPDTVAAFLARHLR